MCDGGVCVVGVWWGDWVVGWGGCRLAAGRSTGLLRLVGVWGITAMGGGLEYWCVGREDWLCMACYCWGGGRVRGKIFYFI